MGVRAARQLFLVGLALALWSAWGRPGWLELVGCYVAALCLTDLALALRVLPEVTARGFWALGLVLALPGVRFAYNARERIAEDAGLVGIGVRMRDRLRLARSPAIAPGLLSTAQPQTFFVEAGAAHEVSVVLGALRLDATAVGPGLFRVDYDPRRDAVPNVLDGELPIRIVTDGDEASRTLQVVTPLAHPRWFCRSPSGERAATPSEETDELIVVGAAKPTRIPVGDGPISCAFVDDDHVAVSHRHAAELCVVDVAASSLQKLALDGPLGRVVYDAQHAEILVAHGGAAPAILHVGWPHFAVHATSSLLDPERGQYAKSASPASEEREATKSRSRTQTAEHQSASHATADTPLSAATQSFASHGSVATESAARHAAENAPLSAAIKTAARRAASVAPPPRSDDSQGVSGDAGDSRVGARARGPDATVLMGANEGGGPAADQLALCGDALIATVRSDASLRRYERQGERFVELQRVGLGRAASALAVDAGRSRVFVTVTDYRTADSAPQLGNHFVQDQLLVFDANTLELQQRVLTARRSERQTKPGDMDQGGSPLGLWPLRDGRLGVAFAGTDELWRLSFPEAEPSALRFEDFYAPHGVVELADGTVWLASPAAGALAKLAPGSTEPVVVPLTPDDRTLASARPAALARRIGERGFYESTRSGISCQSCHMHADSDFAAYNLGDHRLVPTLSVQGLFGTAPYLRDGSYPRLSDLDDVAQQLYRGYVRQQPGRRYALQAYVESLPRTRPWPARQHDAERRGYAVFQRAGCVRCHAPPAFTSLGQLPLAALFPRLAETLTTKESLDVPSLLSVSTSPPYLHDGRAPNLRAVLTEENPDNLHGDTRNLTNTDLNDLLHFLESL